MPRKPFFFCSPAKERDLEAAKLETNADEFRTDKNMVPGHLTALKNT